MYFTAGFSCCLGLLSVELLKNFQLFVDANYVSSGTYTRMYLTTYIHTYVVIDASKDRIAFIFMVKQSKCIVSIEMLDFEYDVTTTFEISGRVYHPTGVALQ
jgi:hypothetical protein